MGAVGTVVVSGLRHRFLQAAIIGLVLAMASGAATLALATLVQSQAPFETAFNAANGAHVVVDYDGSLGSAKLASTTHAPRVTGAAGPWPVAEAGILIRGPKGETFLNGGISGRSNPSPAVDRMTLTSGRWWTKPGEVVLSSRWANTFGGQLGDTITLQEAPPPMGKGVGGSPTPTSQPSNLPTHALTVVGIAASISTPTTAAWMSPSDVAMLTPGRAPDEEMLYRVTPSATAADVGAATTLITNRVPSGHVVTTSSYLTEKGRVDRTASIFVPILLAFSLFALLAAAFIIANAVSGIVLARYRDIGVLKSVGYTPAQVTVALVAEILVPACVGAAVGVAAGIVGSQPILAQTAESFGLPASFTISAPVVIAVLIAGIATTGLSAIGPALGAGKLSVVSALTRGAAPSSRVGWESLLRLVHRLPLPATQRIGFGSGLTGPVRTGMTLGALVVGVMALVFAVGLDTSLGVVASDLYRDRPSPVRVEVDSRAANPDGITSLIAGRPNTAKYVTYATRNVTVPALGSIPFIGYRGDSSWIGYVLIQGRWFASPGEVVAPSNVFRTAGLHVGDKLTVSSNGRSLTVTLVGEIFDQARENSDNLVLRGVWTDLAALNRGLTPTGWEIRPTAGTDPREYASDLRQATHDEADAQVARDSQSDEGFLLFDRVIALLGALLVAISLGGVFNMVLLETWHRTRQTAILKAIGMTPRQVIGTVVASVVPVALMAGVIGVPAGLVLHHVVLDFMADAATSTNLPANVLDVLPVGLLMLFGLAGLAIGAVGAYLPARRTARSLIAPVLQSE